MKRILLSMAIAFAPIYMMGQKIKIKKGNILLNKTQKIGTQEKRYDGGLATVVYTLKDNNNHAITIYSIMGDSGSSSDYYYSLSTNFNDSKWELSASDIKIPMNKGTVRYLMNQGLWDPEKGMDTDAINLKMANTGTAISAERADIKMNEERVKRINPFVKRSGEIVIGGHEGTEVIGYVESPDHYLSSMATPIKIYDINRNLIAKGTSGTLKGDRFVTFDGKEHLYSITHELNEITKPLFLSEAVYLLMMEGYIYDGDVPYDAAVNTFK